VEKKLPEVLETLLTPEVVKGRHVRLMFQDEARFGRMVRIRRCWAPAPQRPVVDNGYEREFQYVYGAVSPLEGELDWRIGPVMNTEQMGTFLAQVSAAHPEEFIVMVVDGASSHIAQALVVPENIRLHRLPGYSPELNPQEHLWDELREKEFPNRVFSDMAGVVRTLETGLPRLAADRDRVRSICAWPWIVSLNLNAHYNYSFRLGGDEWRHRAVERVGDGPQQLGFHFLDDAVGSHRLGASVQDVLLDLRHRLAEPVQCGVHLLKLALRRGQQPMLDLRGAA